MVTKLEQLIADGFDQSSIVVSTGEPVRYRPRCSQCETLVINGVPCHETGCPNQTFECKGCNNRVSRRGAYCEDCV